MADRVYPETGANKSVKFAPQMPQGAYYNVKDQRQTLPLQQPPRAYYDAYNGRPRRRKNRCCVCMAWFFASLVALIIILGIGALVFYLVVHPRAPKYNVQDVRLSSFNISATGSLSSGLFELNAITSYAVEARNPNKKIGIYYDDIEVNVLSEGVNIGQGSVPAFYQGHRNTTNIIGNLTSSKLPLASTVARALQSARNSSRIPLYVTVDVKARIKIGAFKSPPFWVHVRCNVDVNPNIATGSQVIQKQCSVRGN